MGPSPAALLIGVTLRGGVACHAVRFVICKLICIGAGAATFVAMPIDVVAAVGAGAVKDKMKKELLLNVRCKKKKTLFKFSLGLWVSHGSAYA